MRQKIPSWSQFLIPDDENRLWKHFSKTKIRAPLSFWKKLHIWRGGSYYGLWGKFEEDGPNQPVSQLNFVHIFWEPVKISVTITPPRGGEGWCVTIVTNPVDFTTSRSVTIVTPPPPWGGGALGPFFKYLKQSHARCSVPQKGEDGFSAPRGASGIPQVGQTVLVPERQARRSN